MTTTIIYGIYVGPSDDGRAIFYRVIPKGSLIPSGKSAALPSSTAGNYPTFTGWGQNTQVLAGVSNPDSFYVKLISPDQTINKKPLVENYVYKITIVGQKIGAQVPDLTEAPGRVTISEYDGPDIPPLHTESKSISSKPKSVKPKKSGLVDTVAHNNTIQNEPVDNPYLLAPTACKKKVKYDPSVPPAQPLILPVPLKFEDEEFDDIENYFRLGYVTFLLPPSSVSVSTANGTVAVDVLRAQGDLNSVDYNTIQTIQLEFSSFGLDQFNKVIVPILQQYNRMPLLPVTHYYLNSVWNVDAVAIKSVVISTVQGAPGGFSVTLIMEPFFWRAYLPHNSSYVDSFCWPLFKAWCESEVSGKRNPTAATSLDSDMKFFIPRRQSLLDKSQLPTVPVKNVPVPGRGPSSSVFTTNLAPDSYKVPLGKEDSAILDIDSGTVYTALLNLRRGVYKQTNSQGVPVITYQDGGNSYALTQFKAERNIIHALGDSSISVFKNITIKSTSKNSTQLTGNDISLSGELTESEKLSTARDVIEHLKDKTEGAAASSVDNLWFRIPANSKVWTFIWQALNTSTSSSINDVVDMNEYNLSPLSAVSSIAIQFSSHMAALQVEDNPLPIHQYMGGGDGFVSIQGVFGSSDDAALMASMLEEVRELGRFYKPREWDIPYPGFMGITNSVINAIGLKHFIPLNFVVGTMDGFPDLKSYQLDLMEYNPSQIRREEFDFMDKLILQWSLGLALNKSQEDVAKIMERYSNDPDYLEKSLGNFYAPVSQVNPLASQINEGSSMREWRISLIDARLRMLEMYPDMCLPSKLTVDCWIALLKDYVGFKHVPKDPNAKKVLMSMLEIIDISEYSLYTIENIMHMELSNDPMGYVDPDFFCVPAVDPINWAVQMIDSNFGYDEGDPRPSSVNALQGYGYTMFTDSYGVQVIHKAGTRLDAAQAASQKSVAALSQQHSDLANVTSTMSDARNKARTSNSSRYGNSPTSLTSMDGYFNLGTASVAGLTQANLPPIWANPTINGTATDPSYTNSGWQNIAQTNNPFYQKAYGFIQNKTTDSFINGKELAAKIVNPLLALIKGNPTYWGVSEEAAQHLDSGLILGIIMAESDGNPKSNGGDGIHVGLMNIANNYADVGKELKQYTGFGEGQIPMSVLATNKIKNGATALDVFHSDPYNPVVNVLAGILEVAGKMERYKSDPANMQMNGVFGYRGGAYPKELEGEGYVTGVMQAASMYNNILLKGGDTENNLTADEKNSTVKLLEKAGIPPDVVNNVYMPMLQTRQIGMDDIYRYHLAQVLFDVVTWIGERNEFRNDKPWDVVLEHFLPGSGKWEQVNTGGTRVIPRLPDNIKLYLDPSTGNGPGYHTGKPYPTDGVDRFWYGYTAYTDILPSSFSNQNGVSNVYLPLYSAPPPSTN